MSITYNQDTSALVINDTFKLDLTTPRISMPSIGNKKALAIITNESGCTLQISLSGGRNFTLPAGAWTKPFQIYPQDSKLSAQVQNILPNSQINLFSITVYNPGEEVIEPAALGNSPIGISGNVATSNIQSLTNDGNAAPTQIIESTPTGQGSSSFSLNNDGSGFWQILSANTLKQIINAVRGNTGTGKAVINIGDSTDPTILTLHGSIQGSQPANVGALTSGAITGSGANSLDNGAIITNGNGDIVVGFRAETGTSTNPAVTIQQNFAKLWIFGDGNAFSVMPFGGGFTRAINIYGSDATNVVHLGVRVNNDGSVGLSNNQVVVDTAGDIIIENTAKGLILANLGLGANGAAGASIGRGINGTETDVEITSIGQILSLNSDNSFYIKYNNYWNGTNDKFITTASGQAWQFFVGSSGPQIRFSTNTPSAGTNITWSAFQNVLARASAGGGAAGNTDWVGTTDPGTNAGEGDTWVPA